MKESVQGWRSKWFYLRDQLHQVTTQACRNLLMCLRQCRRSHGETFWLPKKKYIRWVVRKGLEVKDVDGQTMICTVIVVVFLRRRIQPVMSRAHHMWLYSGPKDETRVNATEFSDKELLDKIRCLTYFNQEDSIPLLSLQDPYKLTHQPAEVISIFLWLFWYLPLASLF
jgi:hypothetical protein